MQDRHVTGGRSNNRAEHQQAARGEAEGTPVERSDTALTRFVMMESGVESRSRHNLFKAVFTTATDTSWLDYGSNGSSWSCRIAVGGAAIAFDPIAPHGGVPCRLAWCQATQFVVTLCSFP